VRAKASQENLKAAATFADIVTITVPVQSRKSKFAGSPVDCKGPLSIFSALAASIPEIVRTSDDGTTKRTAVTEAEFNKFFARLGYTSFRYRHRIPGKIDKWSKGIKRWRNIRWVNPCDPSDLDHLRQGLAKIRSEFPSRSSLIEGPVIQFLQSIPTSHPNANDESEDSEQEMDSADSVNRSPSNRCNHIPKKKQPFPDVLHSHCLNGSGGAGRAIAKFQSPSTHAISQTLRMELVPRPFPRYLSW
jgi:hypothetical protein